MSENAPTIEESKWKPKVKGLVALGAGVALLAGGGGTLALWSDLDSETLGTVTAGNLDLAAGAATWEFNGDPVDAADIPALRVVPGDVLTVSKELTVSLEGDSLEAALTADLTGLEGAVTAGDVTVTPTFTPAGSGNAAALTEADDGEVFTATVDISFSDTVDQQKYVTETLVSAGAIDFVLAQL